MQRRPYQSVIADILFWNSVSFDLNGFAEGVIRVPTLEEVCLKRRTQRYVNIRFDISTMLRERAWSLARIGKLLGRDHSSILNMLRKRVRRPSFAQTRRRISHVEQLTI